MVKFENYNISEPFKPENNDEEYVTVSAVANGLPHVVQVEAVKAPKAEAVLDPKHKDHKKALTEIEEFILDAFEFTPNGSMPKIKK